MVFSSPPPPSAVFLKSAFPLTFSPEFLSHQATHPSHSCHISTPEPERELGVAPGHLPAPGEPIHSSADGLFSRFTFPEWERASSLPPPSWEAPPPFFSFCLGGRRWAAEGKLRAPRLLDGKSELVIPKVPAGLAPTYPFCSVILLHSVPYRGPVLLSFFRTFFPPCGAHSTPPLRPSSPAPLRHFQP